VRIAVDVMGGDNAPKEILAGALDMAKERPDWEILLVGQEDIMPADLPANVKKVFANLVMAMDESVENIRKKTDSSIWVATKLIKEGLADAVVSAGSTGAQIISASLILGRVKGVDRPAIGIVYPTLQGGKILLDAGANPEIKPPQFLQFARMGSVFAKNLLKTERPKVALISNGTEAGKGTDNIVEAHKILAASELNFIGNIEGRDIPFGEYDVAVCDGFVGNMILKVSEGFAKVLLSKLKEEFLRSLFTKIAAGIMKPGLKRIMKLMDDSEYGGAPLLGVKGISIVCHGKSDAKAIKNGIKAAAYYVETGFVEQIEESMQIEENLQNEENL